MGHYYEMGEDLTGCEGNALILKEDYKVYKSTSKNDKRIIGFLGEIVSGAGSVDNIERDSIAHVISIGDSFNWKRTSEIDASGNVTTTEVKNINGIKVCNEGGNIETGDLLVTSSKPGIFMKQSDDIIRSYTAAKSGQNVTFTDGTDKENIYCFMICG